MVISSEDSGGILESSKVYWLGKEFTPMSIWIVGASSKRIDCRASMISIANSVCWE